MKHRKKVLSLIMTAMIIQGAIASVSLTASAAVTSTAVSKTTYSENGYKFTVSNSQAVITKYTGSSVNVTIPSTLKGYKVTTIDNNAFYQCKKIKSLEIPNTVKNIGNNAFGYCTALKSVTIPSSVTSIGTKAFRDCTMLKSVTVPSSVKNIGTEAFGYYRYFNGRKKVYEEHHIPNFIIYGNPETQAQVYAKSNFLTFKTATKVTLNKSEITLGSGEGYSLTATISPNNTGAVISWRTSNTSVANVSSSGRIVAKSIGTATITATDSNGSTATCKVTVKKAPTSVSLNKTSITLNVGKTFDLNSSLPSGCASYSIVYTSNNTSVASVKSAGGLVTAKKKGTATITAKTYNGKTATCKVTVK